jgi:hypothetical protein
MMRSLAECLTGSIGNLVATDTAFPMKKADVGRSDHDAAG